ncbi:MAG: hypothetical protein HDQ98_11735 [Lachnospiraceae bacterium]|nr:hypothetical protein [Lachnospiraceae bacterium]
MKKEIMNAPVVDAKEPKKATLTKAGKAVAAKKAPARKSVTKIGEPVIVKPEEAKAAEEKKAKAKVVKALARKKVTESAGHKPEDYTTVIKDGLAQAVPKSEVEKGSPVIPAFSEDDKKRYAECVNSFRVAWDSYQKSKLTAAFILYEIDSDGLFRLDGYNSIVDFGMAMFGIQKSTIYNLIDIVGRFGAKIESGKPVTEIADKYKGFSQSQLGVMVGHTDDELDSITPDMSVRDIKKALKNSSKGDDSSGETEKRGAKGKSGADDQKPSEPTFRANLIHEFTKVEEWDAMRDPKDELDFVALCNTIRKCLSMGHSVRIMDCWTGTGN